MKTAAYEARVENGVIRLIEPASLPEHTRGENQHPWIANMATPAFSLRSENDRH